MFECMSIQLSYLLITTRHLLYADIPRCKSTHVWRFGSRLLGLPQCKKRGRACEGKYTSIIRCKHSTMPGIMHNEDQNVYSRSRIKKGEEYLAMNLLLLLRLQNQACIVHSPWPNGSPYFVFLYIYIHAHTYMQYIYCTMAVRRREREREKQRRYYLAKYFRPHPHP